MLETTPTIRMPLAESLQVRFGPKKMTDEEFNAAVGRDNVVRIKFIPEMITTLVMDKASDFCDHCRDHRISYFHKHNRLIRQAVKEYHASQRRIYERRYGIGAYEVILRGYQIFRKEIGGILGKMHAQYLTQASKQYENEYYHDMETPALISEMVLLIHFVRRYDDNMARFMESATGRPCYRKENPFVGIVNAMCIAIAEDWNVALDITPEMSQWIRTLTNKTYDIASDMINDKGRWATDIIHF